MNIAQAKQSIKDTIRLYLKKDELGDYILPMVRQRPVFLLGAPGIGKTAIILTNMPSIHFLQSFLKQTKMSFRYKYLTRRRDAGC